MAASQTVPTPSTNLTILNKPSSSETPKLTIWFDIDNTLYSRHCKINEFMSEKILAYFIKLGLPLEQAQELHTRYYKEYGLAIRGLIRHHSIDPLDYDKNCDLAIPLEDILSPDQGLRQLLLDIDRSKARVWCITNAYKTHALRVLKIMNLSDLIEGVVSCDYTNHNFHCKPEKEYYQESIVRSLGQDPTPTDLEATDFTNHLLVDDALINIVGASKIGYGSSVHFDEDSTTGNGSSSTVKTEDGTEYQRITALDQLRNLDIWKDCFLKK
ncbi:hypothetical protein MJO29_009879 [Puccinia striiformis f. sp. tritici]|uniref:hypothetical protein n=1 Tax=Puccinia striiformis f. sp. tritici TaxID=168172 RepID=UPI0020080BC5|nr:hypothetical protein Pst134EA_018946 [Puccinia striiformis f. sp. tritici]KAH9458790.1 hypothetical protein Pst134EA_018946 [Puccinia striiformis f. sp. tritici]KAI7948214.1 hypothetical protein MJO29_009879 [Puccinia striiformis f. sp. tritici]